MSHHENKPLRIINSIAPIRIADNGGWTDTWFAKHGKIFNIAVSPYAEVQIEVYSNDSGHAPVEVFAENYGDRFTVAPGTARSDRHALLGAAIESMKIPGDHAIHVTIYSDAPAGASTGTSAAITVALIGALDRLRSGKMTSHEIAYAAHHVEMNMLGLQCGIQDQICSAYGGINYIEMTEFPSASVSQIQASDAVWWELEHRLVLVYLGKSHSSSDLHRKVVKELEDAGPECAKIEALRHTAERSRDAICSGDFEAFGRAMIENTEAQARLHPELVGVDARTVISIAKEHCAVGWKVNGAGGDGGSLTILCDSRSHVKRNMVKEIEQANPLYKNIPISLSRFGLRTWET